MVCRYPNDTIDRFWWTDTYEWNNVNVNTGDANMGNLLDYPLVAVLQTNVIGGNICFNFTGNPLAVHTNVFGPHITINLTKAFLQCVFLLTTISV